MRTNQYRKQLLKVLTGNNHSSIADLQKMVPSADYSTIYRNVEQMVSEGVLRKVVLDKGTTLYERIEPKDEHGHFVCTHCSDVESIQTPKLRGAFVRNHTVTDIVVRGLCQTCKAKQMEV